MSTHNDMQVLLCVLLVVDEVGHFSVDKVVDEVGHFSVDEVVDEVGRFCPLLTTDNFIHAISPCTELYSSFHNIIFDKIHCLLATQVQTVHPETPRIFEVTDPVERESFLS